MNSKKLAYLIVLLAILALVIFLSCTVGSVNVSLGDNIVLNIRLPRVIFGALIGVLLAVSGVILQGVLRNPLSDPYILGVSSGAAVGAAAGFLFPQINFVFVPMLAFLGAMLAVIIVYKLATAGGVISTETLILSGVAVSMFLSSILALLVIFGGSIYPLYFWLLGGLSGGTWDAIWIVFPYVVAGFLLSFIFSRDLNVILLGEESALSLGVDVPKIRIILLSIASLMSAAAVSLCGIIGFVGLIVPHISRMIFGADNRALLPVSAILGAIILVLSDTIARTVFAPVEIPIGIVTSLFGVPFFIYIMRKRRICSK